jgi:hypothetical protein
MDPTLQSQLDAYLHRLDHLTREGLALRDALERNASDRGTLTFIGQWQRECAATISQLSGGSKAHWLSRAYSEAFLMPADAGGGTEVSVLDIVNRILGVLAQATASLIQSPLEEVAAAAARPTPGPAARFDFVRDLQLRTHLERAYGDSRDLYERGEFALAFVTSCSVLDAIVTEALERVDRNRLLALEPTGAVGTWSFSDRLGAAEQLGAISAACARLPASARLYRELLDEAGNLRAGVAVSDIEAKRTAQVLRIIIRDLSPGR